MKNFSLKTSLRLCVLLAAFVISSLGLTSCEEDEPKDTTAPDISFANLTANKEVSNTITISLNASDDGGLDKIALLVDGNQIATITQAPFEFSWDSNTVPDGSHTIKIVATDKAENTVEKEVVIVVKNILATIDIAADHLASGTGYSQRGFVFLSDAEGKVIISAEYTNGQHLELKSSTFNGSKFYLTEVLLNNDVSDGTSVDLWTFTDIERGKWVIAYDREDDDETYAGDAKLNFSNAAASAHYNAYSNGDEAYADNSSPSSTVRIKKSPSKLYVVRNNDGANPAPPTFNLYSNIIVGPNPINLSSVNQALTKVTATVPSGATYAVVGVQGYLTPNNYTEPYKVGFFNADQGTFNIYYPGSAFPSYYIEHFFEYADFSYSRGSRTEFSNFSLPQHNEGFTFADNRLRYSASGNYDVLVASLFNQGETAYWSLILPQGSSLNVPVLQLPPSLNGLDIPSMRKPDYYGILDFEGITNYNDFKTFIRNSKFGFNEAMITGKNYIDVQFFATPAGGRTKHHNSRHSLSTKIRKGK
jgi:Bacterial Ig domain